MDLDAMKKYLRVESTDDDTLIQSLMTAAISYINGKTGKTKKVVLGQDGQPVQVEISTDDLWCTAVQMLVTHWYENRGVEVTGTTVSKYSYVVDEIINHISMCGEYV